MEWVIRHHAARTAARWRKRIDWCGDVDDASRFVIAQFRRMPSHLRLPLLVLSSVAILVPAVEIPPVTRFYDSLFLLAWLEGIDRAG